jgi:hypothetical protein
VKEAHRRHNLSARIFICSFSLCMEAKNIVTVHSRKLEGGQQSVAVDEREKGKE